MKKHIDALNHGHEQEIQALNSKHAEASKSDREKIIQLETKLREAESKNLDLERRSRVLFEDTAR